MTCKNRILGFLLTIIFMMVCSSSAYSVTLDSTRNVASRDLLKNTNQDANRQVAVWNDALLPIQVCAPRQFKSPTFAGSSPFLPHFNVVVSKFPFNCSTYFISKSRESSPFRPLLSRYYYIIALECFLC